jgi:threonine aldolase
MVSRSEIADFRSDTLTRPTDAMREAMARAIVGDDVFGEDPTVKELEARVAALLGKDAGLFVPSGTMANQIAINVFTSPGDEIIAEERSHVLTYEVGGIGAISGVQCRPLRAVKGVLDPELVAAAIRGVDIHLPRTSLLCLEQTHNLAGGAVVPLAALDALHAVAKRHGVAILIDGARLLNAAIADGVAPAEYGARADVLWIALSKGLSCPAGSVMAASRDVIERCRRVRKRLGGGMRQIGILAAAGLVALDTMVERLAEDHARVQALGARLLEIDGVDVDLGTHRTNILMVRFARPIAAAVEAALVDRGVLALALEPALLRFVTHREVGDADVARAAAAMHEIVPALVAGA